jgi:rhodanese-related sulfurtransferase
METTDVNRITVDELRERLERDEPLVFVDARGAEAWSKSDHQIPGSIRVPPDDVDAHVHEIPRGRAIVTYCT